MQTEALLPDFTLERQHGGLVCGIDEAGRGPLAGPVVAAAVIWHEPNNIPTGINDSKQLKKSLRGQLYDLIVANAHFGIGEASVEEIDTLNILGATKLAMLRAYQALGREADCALIDGNQPPKLPCRTVPVVRGDSLSLSIAAASILAKVSRDRLMESMSHTYPGYGFESHVGYGTAQHREALQRLGVCPIHRRSFSPIQALLSRTEAA